MANADVFPGTPGDDCYWGGWFGDNIYGQGGQDRLSGFGGLDYIDGGAGYDYCGGGGGDDTIINCEETRPDGFYFCSGTSSSAANLEQTDIAGYDTVIANENLTLVEASGTGTVVVLFPISYEDASISEKTGSDIETIKANGDKALDAIISSLPYLQIKELIQNDIIAKENFSYELPVRALNKSEAKNIAEKLFKKTNSSIEMVNPYDPNKKIGLTNVTYIGFKNSPLIPVFAE